MGPEFILHRDNWEFVPSCLQLVERRWIAYIRSWQLWKRIYEVLFDVTRRLYTNGTAACLLSWRWKIQFDVWGVDDETLQRRQNRNGSSLHDRIDGLGQVNDWLECNCKLLFSASNLLSFLFYLFYFYYYFRSKKDTSCCGLLLYSIRKAIRMLCAAEE